MTTYRGKAPLTMVTLLTGRTVYVYRGDLVPADITPFDLSRFLKEGFLEEVVVEEVLVAEVVAVPVVPVSPVVPSTTAVVDGATDRVADPTVPPEGEAPESTEPVRPLRSAPKDDWVAWAVAHGADLVEAEASTKQALVEAFGA